MENSVRIWRIEKIEGNYRLKMGNRFVRYDSADNLFRLSSQSSDACEFEIENETTESENLYQFKLKDTELYLSSVDSNDTDNIVASTVAATWRIEKVHGGKLIFGYDLVGNTPEDQSMVENAGYSFAAKYIGGHNDETSDINNTYVNSVRQYNNNTFRIVSLFERNPQQIEACPEDNQAVVIFSKEGDNIFYIMRDPEGCAQQDACNAISRAEALSQPEGSAIYFAFEPTLLYESRFTNDYAFPDKEAIGDACFDYVTTLQDYLSDETKNPLRYKLGIYCESGLYHHIKASDTENKLNMKYLLAGSSGSSFYSDINRSDKYDIRQTRELFCYEFDEKSSEYVRSPRRYGNFFNNDNEMTYKTLDEIGAWR